MGWFYEAEREQPNLLVKTIKNISQTYPYRQVGERLKEIGRTREWQKNLPNSYLKIIGSMKGKAGQPLGIWSLVRE